MTIDLDTLEALAKAATPGPWNRKSIYSWDVAGPSDDPPYDIKDARGWEISFCFGKNSYANAAYTVAANPTTMLALIAEIRKLRAELEYVRELHAEVSAALRNKELDAMLADNELMEFMQKQ